MSAAALRKILPRLAILLVVAGIIGGYSYYHYFIANRPEDPNVLETSGVIEAIEVRVGTKGGGPISELPVEEGDEVSQGQVLARLETIDLELKLKEAQAAAAQAGALLADLRRGLRREEISQFEKIAEARRAVLERAEAATEQARSDFERYGELVEEQALPAVTLERAKTAYVSAQKAEAAARKDLEATEEQVQIAKMGSRRDQVQAAEWRLKQVEAVTAQLEQRIKDSEIISPITGRVSIKNMEQGEIAAPGATIVTLVDLERPWVRGFVPEHKLGRIRLGMKANVYSDSFPGKTYKGVIRHVATEAEFTPKNVQTQEERVKLVYAIKIYVDNPKQELKPGQPVDAVVRLDQ